MLIEFLKIMGLSALVFIVMRVFWELVDPAYGANYSAFDANVSVLVVYVAHLMHKRKKGDD